MELLVFDIDTEINAPIFKPSLVVNKNRSWFFSKISDFVPIEGYWPE